jgi:hypothetical protein
MANTKYPCIKIVRTRYSNKLIYCPNRLDSLGKDTPILKAAVTKYNDCDLYFISPGDETNTPQHWNQWPELLEWYMHYIQLTMESLAYGMLLEGDIGMEEFPLQEFIDLTGPEYNPEVTGPALYWTNPDPEIIDLTLDD